jgi:2Fe-2S ferredoxin
MALDDIPFRVGVNNHMGSRFTSDAKGMALVMVTLKDRGLMFLDSRTSAQTQAANAARAAGLPTLSRDVFLDNDEEGGEVKAELGRLEQIALKHGVAIEHACDMVCACATCHVLVRAGADTLDEPDDEENDQLDHAWGLEPSSRLACCVRLGTGDITIALPLHSRNHAREHN